MHEPTLYYKWRSIKHFVFSLGKLVMVAYLRSGDAFFILQLFDTGGLFLPQLLQDILKANIGCLLHKI